VAGRTVARLILSLIIFCLAAELFGLAAYYVDTRALFYLHRKTYPELLPGPQDRLVVREALHPYFGPTHRPGTPFDIPGELRTGTAVPERMTTNNFGFVSPHDYPVVKTSDDQVILGVFGGSVGVWFCQIGAPPLIEALRANPYFRGREIVPLCFAHEGYKQPQQALLLAYFLSIGQVFDLVVNIDGFNDVALAALNDGQGLDISMPSVQHLDPLIALVNRSALTPEKLESLAAIFRDRQTLVDLAGRIQANRSAAVNVVLDSYYARVSTRYSRELGRFSNLPANPPENALIQATPSTVDRDGAGLFADIADLWWGASLLMDQMVEARGGAYVHVLQPNQYFTRRRFAPAEAATALNSASPYRLSVETGYPVLIAAARRLTDAGVTFVDGTSAFDAVGAPVYMDDCCHYTLAGNRALADVIAESILASPGPWGDRGPRIGQAPASNRDPVNP
jgi:hypothetical protein